MVVMEFEKTLALGPRKSLDFPVLRLGGYMIRGLEGGSKYYGVPNK